MFLRKRIELIKYNYGANYYYNYINKVGLIKFMTDDDALNFNSITPAALAVLEAKSFTSIPFAKETYGILTRSKSNELERDNRLPRKSFAISKYKEVSNNKIHLSEEIILRIMHFETRYLSIDKGLRELDYNNVLELASGFSFRGLDFCKNPIIHFIDTDLHNIIESKKKIISELTKRYCDYQSTNLIVQSLNVFDEKEFFNTISIFNDEPMAIVNEGLLIYLNLEQKEQLCKIIHEILSKHGGYWINADIYQNDEIERKNLDKYYNQDDKNFVANHNIENNKFIDFGVAKDFFSRCGFEISKKIEVEERDLSSFKLLSENYPSSKNKSLGKGKTRETWILKPR